MGNQGADRRDVPALAVRVSEKIHILERAQAGACVVFILTSFQNNGDNARILKAARTIADVDNGGPSPASPHQASADRPLGRIGGRDEQMLESGSCFLSLLTERR